MRGADEMSYEILLDLEKQTQERVVEKCKKDLFEVSRIAGRNFLKLYCSINYIKAKVFMTTDKTR